MGESIPVNEKLSEIFLQLHISEKSGRGVPKIIEMYGKEAFSFRENSIVVTIPFERINKVGDKICIRCSCGGVVLRTEEEMYSMILRIAEEDERVKAIYMNGSRTNKNVPKDIFQDYDVVYVVTDTRPFIDDKEWINRFGEIWFMQYPDEHPDFPSDKENFYGWLMQFKDGNRIDLHVESIQHAKEHINDDKLCKILLDKDNILPDIPEATDEDYFIIKPSKEQFLCTCTEFWWCLNNVAKGLWREELLYVHDMVNFCVRKQLEKVLSWEIGIKTDFSVSVGKSAKYMNKWLEQEDYEKYLSTYSCGTIGDCWKAVFTMIDLFSPTARYVAEQLDYNYNSKEENACIEFLNIVLGLPKDAKEIVKDI